MHISKLLKIMSTEDFTLLKKQIKQEAERRKEALQLLQTDVSSSILSDDDFKQFEKLFDKISAHLEHPMSICQGVNDGYSIGVYDIKTGELKTQAMSYNVKNCVNLIKERL
jgi:hypothetical protein